MGLTIVFTYQVLSEKNIHGTLLSDKKINTSTRVHDKTFMLQL